MYNTPPNGGLPVVNGGAPIPIIYGNATSNVAPQHNQFMQAPPHYSPTILNPSLPATYHTQYPTQNRRKRRANNSMKSNVATPKYGRMESLEENVKALLKGKEEAEKAKREKIAANEAAKIEKTKIDLERTEASLLKEKAKFHDEKAAFQLEKEQLAKQKKKQLAKDVAQLAEERKKFEVESANISAKKLPWYRRPIF